MYGVVLFLVAATALASADMDEKCMKIFHPKTMFCCTKKPSHPPDKLDMRECFGLPSKPFTTCEREVCMAQKRGYAKADGSIDKTAVKDIIEKKFENQPELVELVRDKCIDGDINMYAPQDSCDAIKMRNCMQLQLVLQCPEFSDEDDCSGTTALVEECSKTFS